MLSVSFTAQASIKGGMSQQVVLAIPPPAKGTRKGEVLGTAKCLCIPPHPNLQMASQSRRQETLPLKGSFHLCSCLVDSIRSKDIVCTAAAIGQHEPRRR